MERARNRAAAYQVRDRAAINQRARERRRRVRQRVIAKYGGCCQCCGEAEYAFLVIDHVLDDGHTDRKRFANSQGFYSYLNKRRRMARYQILCCNCNSAKSFHGGCPHTKMPAPIPVMEPQPAQINFIIPEQPSTCDLQTIH